MPSETKPRMESEKLRAAAVDLAKSRINSPTFCILPWISLYSRVNGEVGACCDFRDSLGTVKEAPLETIWNSDQTRRLRRDMLQGRQHPGCSVCYTWENFGVTSRRQRTNAAFERHFPLAARTGRDGSLEGPFLRYLQLGMSKACNFRCRSCGPAKSTAWYEDARSLRMEGWEVSWPLKSESDREVFWLNLERILPRVEGIHFTGGEPLLQEEHYRVLDFLIRRKMFHVSLAYNTNFSVTRFQGHDVFELWARFENVMVLASLDAAGARGEYLRKGQNWLETLANRRRMLEACPKAQFRMSSTVSLFNAWHLPDLHQELVESGSIDPCNGAYLGNILYDPVEYHIQALLEHLKAAVAERYEAYAQEHERRYGRSAAAQLREGLESIVRAMRARDLSAELPRFRDITRRLDALRGESFAETFPELAELMKD